VGIYSCRNIDEDLKEARIATMADPSYSSDFTLVDRVIKEIMESEDLNELD
jgi:hypothetical protein